MYLWIDTRHIDACVKYLINGSFWEFIGYSTRNSLYEWIVTLAFVLGNEKKMIY